MSDTMTDIAERALADRDRFRAALIRCAIISGADVSDGVPTWPSVDVWTVEEVQRLRDDYDSVDA